MHLDCVQRIPSMAVSSKGTLSLMPYPSKTNRRTILDAAVKQVERDGPKGLSLRLLAASLGLSPNALYRYFHDRAQLEAAISNEGVLRLHGAMVCAVSGADPEQAIRDLSRAYLKFGRNNPSLYTVLMTPGEDPLEKTPAQTNLWNFVFNIMKRLTGEQHASEATVALWAMLHGMVTLDQTGTFGPPQPRPAFTFALNAFLAGLPRI